MESNKRKADDCVSDNHKNKNKKQKVIDHYFTNSTKKKHATSTNDSCIISTEQQGSESTINEGKVMMLYSNVCLS